jgi:two-component system chemotaxis response regulator CheB
MPFFIIVIGASAGGRDALCKLIATLPQDLNAAIFIVMHVSRQGIDDYLTNQLQKCTSLPCKVAREGLPIQKGHIYIAAVDHHLLVKQGTIHITKGPAENRWRPSIDALFRSAAVHYNEQVIGIILTGLLDDGTVGMQAIKRCGGTCIVQDPREAVYPDMPQSVLDNTMVDFILPVTAMGEAIQHTIANKSKTGVIVPEELKTESALVERTVTAIDELDKLAKQSVFTCPDCGGGLWEIKDGDQTRYRCHIGHAYYENELLQKQFESLNTTLWVALRMMEERKKLLDKISDDEKRKNLHVLAQMHAERARELEVHINNLKELLFNAKPD